MEEKCEGRGSVERNKSGEMWRKLYKKIHLTLVLLYLPEPAEMLLPVTPFTPFRLFFPPPPLPLEQRGGERSRREGGGGEEKRREKTGNEEVIK